MPAGGLRRLKVRGLVKTHRTQTFPGLIENWADPLVQPTAVSAGASSGLSSSGSAVRVPGHLCLQPQPPATVAWAEKSLCGL